MTQKTLLRYEREQRGWSQSHLAELLGTSSISISQWERGVLLPSPHFREKLCALFGKDIQALGLLMKTSPKKSFFYDPFIPFQNLPPSGLVGRNSLVSLLTTQLCTRKITPPLTLHGVAGVGKTALLLTLIQTPEVQQRFPDGILWASPGSHSRPFEHLSRWGNLLQLPAEELKEHYNLSSLAKSLRSHIGSRRFLLVLDDVWQVEDALALQIGGAQCAHLVTTRFTDLATRLSLRYTTHIPELKMDQGKALLASFLPHFAKQKPKAIEQTVREVGTLPLALTLIGKHLSSYDSPQQMDLLQARLDQFSRRGLFIEPQLSALRPEPELFTV